MAENYGMDHDSMTSFALWASIIATVWLSIEVFNYQPGLHEEYSVLDDINKLYPILVLYCASVVLYLIRDKMTGKGDGRSIVFMFMGFVLMFSFSLRDSYERWDILLVLCVILFMFSWVFHKTAK